MHCTRCGGSGFLNIEQVDDAAYDSFLASGDVDCILNWIDARNATLKYHGGCYCAATHAPCGYCEALHDVSVCDCCGNGESWHGTPGEHNYRKGGDEPIPGCG